MRTDTLILGAGPAGLAVAACLARRGVPYLLLERGDAVGSSWRAHYDRLHLHTVKQHSALPFLDFAESVPRYPARAQVVEYLDAYARRLQLAARCGEEVRRVARVGGEWEVTTTGSGVGRPYRARCVVVATGYNRTPHAPRWPGQETFPGPILHSADYRNGAAFRGRRVLVVGLGNTGGEIALDLLEHGARPSLAVRSPVNILPRDFLGRPTQVTSIRLARLPLAVRDAVGRAVSRWAFGDLAALGLPAPAVGPATQVERHGRIPLIDIGTVARVRAGEIAAGPDLRAFTPRGVRLADGREREVDAVVLATGYRPALGDFLENAAALCDARGYPRAAEAGPAAPGLFFVGFANVSTGLLRRIAADARRVAARIAASRAGTPA